MDKKELNDLIDRIGLTGPGGVDKIKKILKELVNGSDDGSEGGEDGGCSCLAPMIVEGTINWRKSPFTFTSGKGTPTFAEALNQMLQGGLVYSLITRTMSLLFVSQSMHLRMRSFRLFPKREMSSGLKVNQFISTAY